MILRIRELREERGISQAELAEGIDMSTVQVSRFETGARRTNTDFLSKVAAFLGVSVSELFKRREIAVVGYIGAGGEFIGIDDYAQGAGMETVEAPPGLTGSAVAVMVRGESMIPVYNDGDILIYGEREYSYIEHLNRRCVCGLSDGRIVVKTLQRGSTDSLFTLISFNSSPMEDVALEWIAKIKWVQPR